MKFKYYLRGVSLGIIFTAIVFIIAIHNHKNEIVSDEEVIKRATKMGMVMSSDNKENADEKTNKNETDTEIKVGEESSSTQYYIVKNESESESVNTDDDTKSEEDKQDKEENNKENKDNKNDKIDNKKDANNETEYDYVIIKVKQGDVCRDISESLAELGMVDDAEAFRKYMGEKGYASQIHSGEYKIPKNSTYEQIAKILIKR